MQSVDQVTFLPRTTCASRQVFTCMDANRDGVVTEEEFVHYCTTNNSYTASLLVLP
jgi:hypothetical protein